MKTSLNHNLLSTALLLLSCIAFLPSSIQAGELPVAPANAPAELQVGENDFTLKYNGAIILTASSNSKFKVDTTSNTGELIEQRIKVSAVNGKPVALKAEITGSSQALAAETQGPAQKTFAMVRTSHGLSHNLRNNAVYDRFGDWMIEFPSGVQIVPKSMSDGTTRFELMLEADTAEIIFRPRFYQKHKNIQHFKPWEYEIRKESITGWCSWWAYKEKFNQKNLDDLLDVWKQKRLADYGYNIIQIDDGFQGAEDVGRPMSPQNMRYKGGRPETWLEWKEELFPSGMTGYVDAVRGAGFSPGVWVGAFFSDEITAKEHPEWFVRDKDNKPFAGPWISYAIDATVPEAADRLVRPTYRGLHNAGFDYVKIDQLRHMLYDNLHHNPEYAAAKGLKPDDIYRAYLTAARKELGQKTFILSCWGVLPESVGLADACRIGGDGYGPVTMQQYNSWNGIVWRNDPDHCDVRPKVKAAEQGNVRKTEIVSGTYNDTIIRPALASIAGCLLMLSDKPDVYADDRNLLGIKRSSPVLFSVPGQLYDFDAGKTDMLASMKRTTVTSGAGMSPIDGDQHGEVCPWWLNEYNLGYDHWNVLHRLNWKNTSVKAEKVNFSDLGLDGEKQYVVFEFWTDKLIGVFKGSFQVPALSKMGLHSFAIREKTDKPQLISTNRHLSQGAADLETLAWKNEHTLAGRSRVVARDRYVLTLHIPDGQKILSATFDGKAAEVTQDGTIARVAFLPAATDSVGWSIKFKH